MNPEIGLKERTGIEWLYLNLLFEMPLSIIYAKAKEQWLQEKSLTGK